MLVVSKAFHIRWKEVRINTVNAVSSCKSMVSVPVNQCCQFLQINAVSSCESMVSVPDVHMHSDAYRWGFPLNSSYCIQVYRYMLSVSALDTHSAHTLITHNLYTWERGSFIETTYFVLEFYFTWCIHFPYTHSNSWHNSYARSSK